MTNPTPPTPPQPDVKPTPLLTQRFVDQVIARAQNSMMSLGEPKSSYDLSQYEIHNPRPLAADEEPMEYTEWETVADWLSGERPDGIDELWDVGALMMQVESSGVTRKDIIRGLATILRAALERKAA